MTSVKIKFDHFSLLFIGCDNVYEEVLNRGGAAIILDEDILKELKTAKVYINVDHDAIQKRINNAKKYNYDEHFKIDRNDVLKCCYEGLFNIDIDSSLDISEMNDEEAELFLMLNGYVPYDENININY